MNICSEAHIPAYKIIYKGAKNSDYNPKWFVCEHCHEKKHFGTDNEIISLEKINWK